MSPSPPTDPNDAAHDLRQQVDFLNEVIIEERRKNDKLKRRLEHVVRKQLQLDADAAAANVARQAPPPRVFCDICEVFDAHETEDCPKQARQLAFFPCSCHL